jgi:UPF0755 protein
LFVAYVDQTSHPYMKRILTLVFLLLLAIAICMAWLVLGPGTSFAAKTKSLYIRTDKTDRASVMQTLSTGDYISHPGLFDLLAGQMGIWDKIKPGRYEIEAGSSMMSLIRKLKNDRQTPIRLVLTKVRTKQDLASALGNLFECDSLEVITYLENPDSTGVFGLDTNNILCAVIPNTYQIYWNTTPSRLMRRFFSEQERFWTPERKKSADDLGLTTTQAYILASIVEEETRKDADKPLIASVYLNRLAKGMKLAADPTVKFALRDFELKRIYDKYTRVSSPYNTYLNAGLPPGPICTPSIKTIDATLQAPKTDYLFFVAKPGFSGNSTFAADYTTHMANARVYQQFLDSLQKAREEKGQ